MWKGFKVLMVGYVVGVGGVAILSIPIKKKDEITWVSTKNHQPHFPTDRCLKHGNSYYILLHANKTCQFVS